VNGDFAAVLLAGGASTRMGSPKAMLDAGGAPLWRRQAELLRGLGPSELLVSAGADWEVEPGPWKVVRDRAAGMGPLAGIDAALGAASADWLLVLAVDMPAMSAGYLAGLLRSCGPAGVVPIDGGTYQGLAAVYPRSIRTLVSEVLSGPDRSVRHLAERASAEGLVTARPVAASERPLFRNVNLPSDLPVQ
jgi:molybdopterin-guanine dinucleotide biosynthesis protein A